MQGQGLVPVVLQSRINQVGKDFGVSLIYEISRLIADLLFFSSSSSSFLLKDSPSYLNRGMVQIHLYTY